MKGFRFFFYQNGMNTDRLIVTSQGWLICSKSLSAEIMNLAIKVRNFYPEEKLPILSALSDKCSSSGIVDMQGIVLWP